MEAGRGWRRDLDAAVTVAGLRLSGLAGSDGWLRDLDVAMNAAGLRLRGCDRDADGVLEAYWAVMYPDGRTRPGRPAVSVRGVAGDDAVVRVSRVPGWWPPVVCGVGDAAAVAALVAGGAVPDGGWGALAVHPDPRVRAEAAGRDDCPDAERAVAALGL